MVPFSSTLGLFQEVTHIAVLGRKESSSSFKEDPIAPEGRAVPSSQPSLHCHGCREDRIDFIPQGLLSGIY